MTALLDALGGRAGRGITAQRCGETSRDVRLALIERLGELASAAQAGTVVRPLLDDFDPDGCRLGAASVLTTWTNKPVAADPDTPLLYLASRRRARTVSRAAPRAVFEMDNGRRFFFHRTVVLSAPLTRALVSRRLPAVATTTDSRSIGLFRTS